MRLIDADALKAVFEEKSSEAVCGAELCKSIIFRINKEPTVDAVPVRHGKWIIRDNPGTGWYRITCSECGEDVTSTAPCIGFFPDAKVIWNYCPDCGARMDWGEGDPNGFNEETIQALKATTERKNLSKVYETLDDMYADMETDCVPVIRCKDCKHWQCDDSESYCDELGIFNTDMNSYCSYAKRKEE